MWSIYLLLYFLLVAAAAAAAAAKALSSESSPQWHFLHVDLFIYFSLNNFYENSGDDDDGNGSGNSVADESPVANRYACKLILTEFGVHRRKKNSHHIYELYEFIVERRYDCLKRPIFTW